jgi:aminotransferase
MITPRTKAIVLNSPANPSGKVMSRDELGWIAEIARRHDLLVITDEIYEYFLYDGHEHISIATLPGMAERTITISGFSKTFSITGWRIGYAACPARWKTAIGYFHDLVYICAPAPFQHGAAAGLDELPAQFYQDLQADYLYKRDMMCEALTKAGLTPSIPQGAYYVLADSSSLPGRNSKEKAMHLLHETGVAAVPGNAFYHGSSGENLLRFCFAKTHADLENACGRLQRLRSAAAV